MKCSERGGNTVEISDVEVGTLRLFGSRSHIRRYRVIPQFELRNEVSAKSYEFPDIERR